LAFSPIKSSTPNPAACAGQTVPPSHQCARYAQQLPPPSTRHASRDTTDVVFPKLRTGVFPPLPAIRTPQRHRTCLTHGHCNLISTRPMNDLVTTIGCIKLPKSTVAEIDKEIDDKVNVLRTHRDDRVTTPMCPVTRCPSKLAKVHESSKTAYYGPPASTLMITATFWVCR